MSGRPVLTYPWPGQPNPRHWGPTPGWGLSWPPCPPPPWPPSRPHLAPPDIFQAVQWLQKMFESTADFDALVKRAVENAVAADPSWLAHAFPTVGVTDGTDAAAGMVGEFLRWQQAVAYTTTAAETQMVNVGVLPAGDWDVWGWAFAMTPTTGINVILSPQPAGFADQMHGLHTAPGEVGSVVVVCPATRALTSVPTPVVFEVITNQGGAPSLAGTVYLMICARRVR